MAKEGPGILPWAGGVISRVVVTSATITWSYHFNQSNHRSNSNMTDYSMPYSNAQ